MTSPEERFRVSGRGVAPSGYCWKCDEWFETLDLDHVIPFVEGGLHDTTNLQWLCKPCHRRKSADELRRVRTGGKLTPEQVQTLRDAKRPPLTAEHIEKLKTNGRDPEWRKRVGDATRRAFANGAARPHSKKGGGLG
jgi:hypothetical protein